MNSRPCEVFGPAPRLTRVLGTRTLRDEPRPTHTNVGCVARSPSRSTACTGREFRVRQAHHPEVRHEVARRSDGGGARRSAQHSAPAEAGPHASRAFDLTMNAPPQPCSSCCGPATESDSVLQPMGSRCQPRLGRPDPGLARLRAARPCHPHASDPKPGEATPGSATPQHPSCRPSPPPDRAQ